MKIIKIIHANTSSEPKLEGESFILQHYDLGDFIARQQPKIIEQVNKQFKELLEEQKQQETKNKSNLIKAVDFFANVAAPGAMNLVSEGVKYIANEDERRELFASLTMKTVLLEFLQDIKNQVQKVEFLSLEMARNQYPNTRNLSIGTYTLHPRDSLRLTRIEHYHKNLALEKDDELIILLGRMGAKSVRIVESDAQQQSGSADLKMNTVLVDVNDVKASTSISHNLDKSKDLFVNFEGNIVDIDSSLLQDSLWFSDDSKLISIFESRRFNPNKIEEYTLRNTYTETFDFDFKLAANYLVVEADLKTEYQTISKKERFFHIEFGKKTK
ncbi:hypothetical protein ACQFX9_23350 [Aliinostoc sp. HNIBRCY26]|uniref:hypothetical protein n=1 Tax=Aliinostoc sp. HNIBRCY26 TaxID=3418997 RepID=UPI003CFF03FA